MAQSWVDEYPEKMWPPELKAKLRWRKPWGPVQMAWYRYIARLESASEQLSPQWDADHFANWTHDELVWRVRFLQGAARYYYLEAGLAKFLARFAAAVAAGMIVGVLVMRFL